MTAGMALLSASCLRGTGADEAGRPGNQPAVGAESAGESVMQTNKPAGNDANLKDRLTPLQYQVTQCSATERPFTGKYHDFKGTGMYHCVVCGAELFSSAAKFDSGTGWPSYWKPVNSASVATATDRAHGMVRTEIKCAKCGAHLGHVFDDGPQPTGQRYCVNSASLNFKPGDSRKAATDAEGT